MAVLEDSFRIVRPFLCLSLVFMPKSNLVTLTCVNSKKTRCVLYRHQMVCQYQTLKVRDKVSVFDDLGLEQVINFWGNRVIASHVNTLIKL